MVDTIYMVLHKIMQIESKDSLIQPKHNSEYYDKYVEVIQKPTITWLEFDSNKFKIKKGDCEQ